MSFRKKFIGAASSFSSALPLSALTAISGQRFILPFYHIVSNNDCKHVKHLYRYKNTAQFESDLEYLARNYKPIAAEDMEGVLLGKYKGQNIMLLTFDDGLREMYEVVAPILLRKGIPAVFFVNNDFIDNRDLMFRYKVSLIIEQYRVNGEESALLLSARNLEELDNKLNGKYPIDVNSFLKNEQPYMTGTQIKELKQKGFTIGSHSLNHPYFQDIALNEQLRQVYTSLAMLKDDYGIKQKLFAFPFTDQGVTTQFFETIFAERKVDFSLGGAGIKSDVHPRQIQRLNMEGWNATAEQILKADYIYYLLLMPLFKNKIKRA